MSGEVGSRISQRQWIRQHYISVVAGSALVATVLFGTALFFARRRRPAALDALSAAELHNAILSAVRCAASGGALVPLSQTMSQAIPDGGVNFMVSVASAEAVSAKPAALAAVHRRPVDAFATIPRSQVIGTLGTDYIMIVNKFPVVAEHCVLVTKTFEPQEVLLNSRDIATLWHVVSKLGGIGFFNSGLLSGASQPRRHMQHISAVALRRHYSALRGGDEVDTRIDVDTRLPIDDAIDAVQKMKSALPMFHFPHAVEYIDSTLSENAAGAADSIHAIYLRMTSRLGLSTAKHQGAAILSHNVIITRRWIMVVPRSAAAYSGINVNALGYAGLLLVREGPPLNVLRETGPMHVLSACALPGSQADV